MVVMSLWPRDPREVPAQTARAARAVVPDGSFCVRLRDTLGVPFQDEAFAALFAVRGRPAEAPGRLALVSVLQFAEGLTDRLAEADLVAPGGWQRTNSTIVLAQIRSLHRLELACETLRAALEAIAACAPDWLRQVAPPA